MPKEQTSRENPKMMGGGGGGGALRRPPEQARNFKASIGKLIRYLKNYWIPIIVALILAIAGTIFNIVGPKQISKITEAITDPLYKLKDQLIWESINIAYVEQIAITLVILYACGAICSYIQSFIMTTITQRTAKRLRTDIIEKINKMPFKYFDSTNHGDIMSRVSNDVDTIAQTLNQNVSSLLSAIVMFLGSLIMMFSINWIMTVSAIGATIIGFALMMVLIKISQKYFVAQQSELGAMNGHIEEIYTGHNVVKAYNGEKAAIVEFNDINDKLRHSAQKSQFISGLMNPIMSFIGNLGYVVVCVVGAVLAINGKADLAVISAFMIYIRLFTNPLSQIAQGVNQMQSAAAASERVFELLGEKELEDESYKTQRLTNIKGDVKFRNVQFGYDPDKIIINDFTADAKPGQKIAIVGPTGAGKTTMVNLLMRFYDVNSGQILIDDVPINELTRENIHDLFCMVLQDTWLFEGTIKENIIYNKKDITDEELIEACKAANVDHFIRTLPNGYNTVLSDNANISMGQKQLFTIARAMIQNSPMLILDEATSSVDTRTEILIQEAMDKLMKDRTSFVIAHRLSTIKNADLILVMKDGDIIESGKHEFLLNQNGFYAQLYNSQFEETIA